MRRDLLPTTGSPRALHHFNEGDKIQIGQRLGSGIQGEVFEGKFANSEYNHPLAIKSGISSSDFAIMQRIYAGQPPNRFKYHIITVLGEFTDDRGLAMMAMTKLPQGDLQDYLPYLEKIYNSYPIQHPLLFQLLFRMALQGLCALSRCHECNVIHHDVKPDNFLLDRHLNIFLSDFGLARTLDGSIKPKNMITPVSYCTERLYKSTKQDLYALGLMFSKFCPNIKSRRTKFTEPEYYEQARMILHDDRKPLPWKKALNCLAALMLVNIKFRMNATELYQIAQQLSQRAQPQDDLPLKRFIIQLKTLKLTNRNFII